MPRSSSAIPLALAAVAGAMLGLGLYTFGYARGSSYLTDRPEACANCHVMRGHYESWMKSSHGHAAVCNDCHTPPGFASHYASKARNGFFHSLAFTTGRFPDEIEITARDRTIAAAACLKCHAAITSGMRAAHGPEREIDCIACHSRVGHL